MQFGKSTWSSDHHLNNSSYHSIQKNEYIWGWFTCLFISNPDMCIMEQILHSKFIPDCQEKLNIRLTWCYFHPQNAGVHGLTHVPGVASVRIMGMLYRWIYKQHSRDDEAVSHIHHKQNVRFTYWMWDMGLEYHGLSESNL